MISGAAGKLQSLGGRKSPDAPRPERADLNSSLNSLYHFQHCLDKDLKSRQKLLLKPAVQCLLEAEKKQIQ